ncbi:hypothetical protein AKJ41_01100 [candidate division MSBL1 archaeon SCGC-AAA259O05]|uniref:Uncharacterized protein n=1 Tax=candidate division MSBL1 archaeon SCGC-AAA259O05 TaxID=1698271 RepID=A0A133V575_9EURY|nr:hypothetical protein AKJ41_01100 [candidate division MSBL1 archaeon SCGC-AAA259O05]
MRFENGDRGGIRGIRVVLPSEEKKQGIDSIQKFIRECVKKNEGNKISSENLYKLYSQFAGSRDMEVQKRKKLTEKIKELSYVEYSNTYRFEGEQKRGFKNIAVNVLEVGHGSQNKSTPRPSPKTTEPSPEYPSKEQKNRGDETKGRENSENGDGPGEHGEEKTVHPVSREPEKKKKERGEGKNGEKGERISQTGCTGKSSPSSPPPSPTPAQRDKISTLREIIRELEDEYDEGALIKFVKDEAEASGISAGFVDEFVERESREGRLLTHEKEGEKVVRLNE